MAETTIRRLTIFNPSLLDLSDDQHELMEAVSQWESAECTDCPAQFPTQREAGEHLRVFGHSIVHTYDGKPVN